VSWTQEHVSPVPTATVSRTKPTWCTWKTNWHGWCCADNAAP